MIELKIEGCCRDCNSIVLELRKFGEDYWVKCIHQDVCGKLEKEKQEGADDEASD